MTDDDKTAKDEKEDKTTTDEPPAKKKRTADRQLTKDDDPDQDDGECVVGNGFRKADENVLAKRRIVKAKRPVRTAEADSTTKSTNPFASVSLTNNDTASKDSAAKPSVFGASSGFTGFGSVSADKKSGFGSTSSGFGSGSTFGDAAGKKFQGFGTATTSGGFGFGSKATGSNLFDTSKVKTSFAFGAKKEEPKTDSSTTEKKEEEEKESTDDDKKSEAATAKSAAEFPDQVELKTGEEDEAMLLEGRFKAYLLKKVDENPAETNGEANTPAAPAVPPSASSFAKPKGDGPDAAAGSPTKEPKADEEGEQWRFADLGAGPLKVLEDKDKKIRIVQRRQGKNPGDPVMNVIINERVWKEDKLIATAGDKQQFKLVVPVGSKDGAATKTIVLKSNSDDLSQSLFKLLEEKIKEAPSCFAPNTTSES